MCVAAEITAVRRKTINLRLAEEIARKLKDNTIGLEQI